MDINSLESLLNQCTSLPQTIALQRSYWDNAPESTVVGIMNNDQLRPYLIAAIDGLVDLNDSWILDFGVGTGRAFRALNSPLHYVGIDISPVCLHKALKQASGLDLARIGDHRLPFKDESFDLCITYSVFPHLLLKGQGTLILSDIHRVLKPGAILLASTFLHNTVQLKCRTNWILNSQEDWTNTVEGCDYTVYGITLVPENTKAAYQALYTLIRN